MNCFKPFIIKIDKFAIITELAENIIELLNHNYHDCLNHNVNDFFQCNFMENCLIDFNQNQSFILFMNIQVDNTYSNFNSNKGILVLYLQINKYENGYELNIVNWLNWIEYLTSSLESSYQFMKYFNNNVDKKSFITTSDALCYKAFFPLISYIPQIYSLGISQVSIYEIMRVFIKQRDPLQKFNKDFARNVYSRIRTNMKKTYNLEYYEPIDIIRKKELLDNSHKGNIYIPDTFLEKNLIFKIQKDKLLEGYINR